MIKTVKRCFGFIRRRWLGGALVATALLIPAVVYAGQAGNSSVWFNGAATVDALTTTVFTAPTNLSCFVTTDQTTSTQNVAPNATGVQVLWPEYSIDGGTPQYWGQGTYSSATVLSGYYTGHATRVFTLSQGQSVRFGCHISSSGTFADSRVSGGCTVSYICQ